TGQPVNPVDAATVAATTVAGLLTGRAASRLTARLLAAPQPPEPRAPEPRAPDPRAPDPPAPRPPGCPAAGRRTRWSLSLGTGLACAAMAMRFGPSPALPAFCYLAG